MTDANTSKGFYDNLNIGFGGKGGNSDYNMPIKIKKHKNQIRDYFQRHVKQMGIAGISTPGLKFPRLKSSVPTNFDDLYSKKFIFGSKK